MTDDATEDSLITLIDFWAEWCGVCRMVEPVLERVVAGHSDVSLLKVNVNENEEMAARMGVVGVPTLLFTAPDGRELVRLSGPMTGSRVEAALVQARAGL